jgi:hypothetical protein
MFIEILGFQFRVKTHSMIQELLDMLCFGTAIPTSISEVMMLLCMFFPSGLWNVICSFAPWWPLWVLLFWLGLPRFSLFAPSFPLLLGVLFNEVFDEVSSSSHSLNRPWYQLIHGHTLNCKELSIYTQFVKLYHLTLLSSICFLHDPFL